MRVFGQWPAALKRARVWRWGLALVALLGLCAAGGWWLVTPAASPDRPPQVVWRSPAAHATVPQGQPVTIEGMAYTPNAGASIARLVLWVDGRLVGEKAGPGNPLANAWTWTPQKPGDHTLVLQAFDSLGRRAAAYRAITVQASPTDADGDGLPDATDACPDQAGLARHQGCPEPAPDADQDGVPDAADACPNEAGPAEQNGCPTATPQDADGDGLADAEDACPNAAGPVNTQGCPPPADADGDGVPDADDPCPDEFGLPGGCPPAADSDGDGVPDDLDACPEQPGPGGDQGCPTPDADNDGVPDAEDACPDEAGPAEQNGCPAVTPQDGDGDGVPDAEDACPDQPGPETNVGCPLADADGDGLPDAEDACPDQAGPPGGDGCPHPDADGDGVPDDLDACPEQPGPEDNHGCPADDSDGDGIPDDADACPQLAGDVAGQGCPGWVSQLGEAHDWLRGMSRICQIAPQWCQLDVDSDGDSVPDAADACPEQPGPALFDGCPMHMPDPGDMPQFACPQFLPEILCHGLQRDWEARWRQWLTPQPEDLPPHGVEDWQTYQGEAPGEPWGPAMIRLRRLTTNTGWVTLTCTVNLANRGWWVLDTDELIPTTPERTEWAPVDLPPVVIESVPAEGLPIHLICWGWRSPTEGEVDLGDVLVVFETRPEVPSVHRATSVDGEGPYRFDAWLQVCSPACP